jgi:phosphate butyryltransferase
MIRNFEDLISESKLKGRRRIAVAAAEDEHVILAIKNAVDAGIVEPTFVGNKLKIESICKNTGFNIIGKEIISENDPAESCKIAVQLIREHKADLLMKGLVSTAALLRAVLDREKGLKKSQVLSHLAFFESPFYYKLFAITDAAMNIAPTLEEKVSLIANATEVFWKLGCSNPKVALICPVETVNLKIESTIHASQITMMGKRGQIKGCLIDGPLALDNAISKEAAIHKGIESEVAGDADLLVLHDLDAGNVLYKALIFLGGAKTAAVVTGASVPIVLTSRADSEESKLYSIALANLLS